MRINIVVTHEDIVAAKDRVTLVGMKKIMWRCPFERAIDRYLGPQGINYTVTADDITRRYGEIDNSLIGAGRPRKTVSAPLTRKAQSWIAAFDEDFHVEPEAFEIVLPDIPT